MKCYLPNLLLLCFLEILFFGCDNNKTDYNNEEMKSMLLLKGKYGSLSSSGNFGCTSGAEINISENYYHLNKLCRTQYFHRPDHNLPTQFVGVNVYFYEKGAYIKNDLLQQYVKKHRNSLSENLPEFLGQGAIKYISTFNYLVLEWVSGSHRIIIATNLVELPVDLIKDYFVAYPPTVKFSPSDFDMQKVLQAEVRKRLDIIRDLEDRRNWFNRYINRMEEYHAFGSQCYREEEVRCWLGITEDGRKVTCPIAFIDDKSDRIDAYEKWAKEIEGKEVIEANINWGEKMRGYCPPKDKDEIFTTADHLGIPRSIIEAELEFYKAIFRGRE